ncbi:MAG: hypothetical protein PVI27_02435 [Desulfobacteraceae bacterium]|jgi:hypothetical protein
MPLYDLNEFLRLSSGLNYNLSAASLNRYNILTYIIRGQKLDPDEKADREYKAIVMEALSYLFAAFGQKRRRLGPMAVLHPMRATALFARSEKTLNPVGLLTALFHDILEDVQSTDFTGPRWRQLEGQLCALLERLPPAAEETLIRRLVHLTRRSDESYFHYIGRLLENSRGDPEAVRVKLADRLDNTLDMHIVMQDPLGGIDFFETLFQLLFVNNFGGYRPEQTHNPPLALNGAKRLYQLFKNAVLLSLIRQNGVVRDDPVAENIFDALCAASLKEAQRNFMHVVGYHFTDLRRQRALLLEVMRYCQGGGSDRVTRPDERQLLDGLFSTYFGPDAKLIRDQRLGELYRNKPLMIEAAIAFIVIFLSFLNDRCYFVRGVSSEGIRPL